MKEYKVLLQQSERNIAQGELGQSLAASKIDHTKFSIQQIKQNIQEQADAIRKDAEFDKKQDELEPSKYTEAANLLAQKCKQVQADIDIVISQEGKINENVNASFQDDELLKTQMQIAKTAKKLQSYVQGLETEYKAAEKERERKQL